jgi:hypothetical protein
MVLAANAPAQYPYGFYGGRGLGFGYSNRSVIIGGYMGGWPRYGYGYYPAYYYPVVPSTTIVIVQPVLPVSAYGLPNFPVVPPLDERDDMIVIRPKKNQNKQAFQPPPVVNQPPPKMPPPQPQPALAPIPEMDRKAESARLVKLGKEAFADEEHGRAAERFAQATRLQPDNAEAFFLLAESQFALGKYREAVASIFAAMKLQPDWPNAKFDPRGLYGNNRAVYAEQLDLLREAVAANPQEPALMFLYGYQLWFLGRPEEAKTFFQKAKPLVTDPKPIDQFLQAPNPPVAAR